MRQSRLHSLLAAILFLSVSFQGAPDSHPIPTSTPTLTSTIPAMNTPTGTSTATRQAVATSVRGTDGMVMAYVPAGEFEMGKYYSYSNELPVHTVFLDAYWIDQTEVTNGQYAKCVATGNCNPPAQSGSPLRISYFGDLQYVDFPVIFVNWDDAAAYCAWAGARLPSEAEWEKAARGTDGRDYPWGNGDPVCSRANTLGCEGDTSQVGAYPSGVSPYGVYDMAGNVSEWVADWYDGTYYSISPASNPLGPSLGIYHVLRGGSWANSSSSSRTTSRDWLEPVSRTDYYGFRCAQSTSP